MQVTQSLHPLDQVHYQTGKMIHPLWIEAGVFGLIDFFHIDGS
jgi:hypothetical protein